jgi:uncharacterized repeat protein (TIGR01451 family)
MKHILTIMLLMTLCFAKAQVVNIPDSNFKNYLLHYDYFNNHLLNPIDSNADGEIQVSEALAIGELNINGGRTNIKDITGIKAFANLHTLIIDSLSVLNYDFTNMAQSMELDFGSTSPLILATDSVIFAGLPHTNIFSGTMHGHTRINNVNSLTGILFFGCKIDDIDLTHCDSLGGCDLYNATIKKINISGLENFKGITSETSYIDTLIARNCENLLGITVGYEASGGGGIYNFIDVAGCKALQSISMKESNIKSFNLSTCPALNSLTLYNDTALRYINIKNGNHSSKLIRANWQRGSVTPGQINICANDYDVQDIRNSLFINYQFINVSPYCNFVPGDKYNTIRGSIRQDADNNGCSNTDPGILNTPLRITDTAHNSSIVFTGIPGNFNYYCGTGNFTVTPYVPYPFFSVSPSSAFVTFDSTNSSIATRDFCVQASNTSNDIEVAFIPTWQIARPGFITGYKLVYKNKGTTTLSGNLVVNFDNSKMNFLSASENVATQNTGQLIWNYNILRPFESKTINVNFSLLPPPINNVNDTLIFLAEITPSSNDATAFDNSFILPQLVKGSFDPNEKQCLEGSKLDISKIGDYLHYQIHFQNEGTDTAFNIVVTDTLTDKLDWNSFEFISSSHPVDVKLNNNKAEFIFQNINLPYKSINEPASNGWVAFKIKPKPSVVIGDSLNNNAAIYFDFNKPVITNTATTIVSSSSVPVSVKLEYFSVNTRNNTNLLNWKASSTYGNAKFNIERSDDGIHFNSIGNLSATSLRCQLPFNFTDNNPLAGKNYYRLKITDADGIIFYSKILVLGNGKAGINILAIANNVVYLNNNKPQTIQLKVIAADGKVICTGNKNITAGNNKINLQMIKTAAGIYTLLVYTSDGDIIAKRFLK